MRFFLPMKIPTKTAQEKKLALRGGRPVLYTPPELRDIRARYVAALMPHRPDAPLEGPVKLYTAWIFPCSSRHPEGTYKMTRPDTDNLLKGFKDAMTEAGFWMDDAQVAAEYTCKRYGGAEGILVEVGAMEEETVCSKQKSDRRTDSDTM